MNLDDPQSRRTVTRKIVEMYSKRKATLKQWFKSSKQRVSLTTDIWTAKVTGNVSQSPKTIFICF